MSADQRTPNHADLWDAYVAGVVDGQKNRQATKEEIDKAADGYVKLWQAGSAAESVEITKPDYPEFTRVSGQCICETCGLEYWRHPHDTEWLDWRGAPYLRKLCDGRLVKL